MTALPITDRSRHYDPALRAQFNAYSAQDAAENARLWREIAADAIGVPRDWAIAAYWQSIADRKARRLVFLQWYPEEFVDQGGPCGHSDPYTGADGCLCRDGYVIPAHIADGLTPDYCDGEPIGSRLFARPHAEHCPQHRTSTCPF
jgi:hypothetical protein